MSIQLEAVFENGIFRPLQPVHLAEHHRVIVTIGANLYLLLYPRRTHNVTLVLHLPCAWIAPACLSSLLTVWSLRESLYQTRES